MASEQNDNTSTKARPSGPSMPSIPGVEIITTASQRASRKMTAVQRTPVGRRVYEVLRNLVWVIPLTVLVWLYAEREQIDKQRITVPIAVKSARADRVVKLANTADQVLSVDIEGTKPRIEQARQELASKQGLQIVAPPQLELGSQVPLPTLESIATNPIFADRGIIVSSPSPATLSLNVDEYQPGIEVRPQVPQDIASRTEGTVELDPPTVILSGPKRALLNPEAPVEVIAKITEEMLPQVPGTREIPAVPLRLKSPNDQIKITPDTVKAKVTLKPSSVRYVINSVPVLPFGSPALLNKYNVVFPNSSFLSRVTVVGPQEEINKISSGEFTPKALIEIKQEDVRDPLPKSPTLYILPEHVTVSDEDKNRTITFKLVDPTQAE